MLKTETCGSLLDNQINFHKITWEWVKGHSGDVYNEEADKLARDKQRDYKFSSTFSALLFSNPPPFSSNIILISPLSINIANLESFFPTYY